MDCKCKRTIDELGIRHIWHKTNCKVAKLLKKRGLAETLLCRRCRKEALRD